MNRKLDVAAVVLICLGLLVSWVFYADLPDPMPTHFGADGEADGFTPQPWGAVMLPLGALVLMLVLRLLPNISPRGFRMDRFLPAYQMVILGAVAFMVAIHVGLIWRVSQGYTNLGGWVPLLVGVLLAFIGNFLNKTEPNFFMGIRTPWTLADPEVWARTHRVGGWAFMLLGLALVVVALWFDQTKALIITTVGAVTIAIGLVAYSYWIYRRLNPG